MIKKILVPLDGSSSAETALPFAAEIAAKSSAEIVLMTATGSASKDLETLFRPYLEKTRDRVWNIVAGYGTGAPARPNIAVSSGPPADAILQYAAEIKADLVVMAARGSTGPGPWSLGSIATRVTVASPIPVMVVKDPPEKTAVEQKKIFRKILVPLDCSPAGEAAVPFVQTMAKSLGCELILFHAVQPAATWLGYGAGGDYMAIQEPEDVRAAAAVYLEGLQKRLALKGLAVKTVLEEGVSAERIINYSRTEPIDAIAISTHGRSGISRWVFGSVTQKVLQAAKPPVLVVRAGIV
jgi:nucleotide-binding universal stress UspA family protein